MRMRLTLEQAELLLAGLLRTGRFAQAEALARRLTLEYPDAAVGWSGRGVALLGLDQAGQAVVCLEKGLSLRPDDAALHGQLGSALAALGRPDQAASHYARVLALGQDGPELRAALGDALRAVGRDEAAAGHLARAVAQRPDHAPTRNSLGLVLQALGRPDEALDQFLAALRLAPECAAVHNNLGTVLLAAGQAEAAAHHFARALATDAALTTARANLGNALLRLGRAAEAVVQLRQALAERPDDAAIHGNLLFALAQGTDTPAAAYLALARDWEKSALTAPQRRAAANLAWRPRPQAGRRLRLGYVSGDFRRHAVGRFLPDLLAGHDRRRVEVFAYATDRREDDATRELRPLADHWRQLAGLDDATAAAAIRHDAIDVLVDLSGHTSHNRLGVFARRAAPVQAHYLGYFASTGLSAMDYFLADATVVPPGEEVYFAETVWRLPRPWLCYSGDETAPAPVWRPDPTGRIWFGGCHQLGKLTPACLALWARLLRDVPQGGLLLKTAALASPATRKRLLADLAAAGIAPERVRLLPASPWPEYLAGYAALDVVLDPVGGHGGVTTTGDALWMGVPVVTLAGPGLRRRMCSGVLRAVGREDWIATDEDAYLAKAKALAADVAGRRALRGSLRATMRRSPLGDGAGLARALEDAYAAMFDAWWGRRSFD